MIRVRMSEESLKGGGGEILVLVVVVGHLVLVVGGLVGLVLVLLDGLEVVEQGLEAVTKEEAGNQGSVCLGQDLSLTLLFYGGETEDTYNGR